MPAQAERDGAFAMTKQRPPMYTAGLDRGSDLVGTVTNMQQIFAGFGPGKARAAPRLNGPSAERIRGRLPKSWANAGAFSLFTLKSKLAHN